MTADDQNLIHDAIIDGYQHAVGTLRQLADLTEDGPDAELLHTVTDLLEQMAP